MQDYKIKQQPSDFIVREDSGIELSENKESCEYAVFRMKKTRYTTEDAVQQLAKSLGTSRKTIGYAGSKDSRANTEQNISIKGVSKERVLGLQLKDIQLEFLGYRSEPLSLGNLEGNSFEIVIRNITKKPRKISRILNRFGEQRFSINNAEVGRAIIKKDFKHAVELVSAASREDKEKMDNYLAANKNDYVGALKKMPFKTLTLYIHALQSLIWNQVTDELVRANPSRENELIPLVGFGTEFVNPEVEEVYKRFMEKEGVSQQEYVVRSIPDLSSNGSDRMLYAEVRHLQIGELEADELNPGKKKCKVTFSLPKGSYATEVIKSLED